MESVEDARTDGEKKSESGRKRKWKEEKMKKKK